MSEDKESIEVGTVVPFDTKQRESFFRAVHAAVVEKPSSISHFYKNFCILEIEQIEQLYLRLFQTFQRFQIYSATFSCEVQLSTGEVQRFSTMDEFKSIDKNQPYGVKSIDFEANFLIGHAAAQKPSPFKVEIGFREVPPSIRSADIMFPDEFFAPIRLHIEFSDYIIARSIKSTIDEWINSLPMQDRQPISKRILTIMDFVRGTASLFVGLTISLSVLIMAIYDPSLLTREVFLFAIFLFFLLQIITKVFNVSLRRKTLSLVAPAGFSITVGDTRKIDSQKNDAVKNTNWAYTLCAGIFVNIVAGLFSTYIAKIIGL